MKKQSYPDRSCSVRIRKEKPEECREENGAKYKHI